MFLKEDRRAGVKAKGAALLCALAAVAGAAVPAQASGMNGAWNGPDMAFDEDAPDSRRESREPMARLMLDMHNDLRAGFGIEPLVWDARLAADARDWAEVLARRGRLEHAPADARRGAGENLSMGGHGYHDAAFLGDLWVREERHLKAGTFPDVSRTGRFADVGHFTQMVWRSTKRVGCAMGDNGTQNFLVCRYYPAGNVAGATFNYVPRARRTAQR